MNAQAPWLINQPGDLDEVIERCSRASRLAVDLEANGLHVYRPQLCTVQLAWLEDGQLCIAIVDTLALDPRALGPILDQRGPVKILHDFSFDAGMLAEHDIVLAGVEDTSVAARFLGEQQTGLASLARNLLDVALSKKLQSHNWALRPLTGEQLSYLASDVAHLFALRDRLWQRAEQAAILPEIALECAYKLHCALAPREQDTPPAQRLKGYAQLEPARRALVRCLHAAREQLAQACDRPPHYLASNSLLMDIANAPDHRAGALKRRFSSNRTYRRHAATWLRAVEQAEAGLAPAEHTPAATAAVDRDELTLRKRVHDMLGSWRRKQAAARNVDAQVIIPGHCMGPLGSMLLTLRDAPARQPPFADIVGFGKLREDRYGAELCELGQRAINAEQVRLVQRARQQPDQHPE